MLLNNRFIIESLSPNHIKKQFTCGNETLDNYLKNFASQDQKKAYASVFILKEIEFNEVVGYYTLSMSSIYLDLIADEKLKKKLPKYCSIPAVKLGRLAVDIKYKNKKLGKLLLIDSMKRSLSNPIAWRAFIVDAIDDNAVLFYKSFGFIESDKKLLYIMRETIEHACQ